MTPSTSSSSPEMEFSIDLPQRSASETLKRYHSFSYDEVVEAMRSLPFTDRLRAVSESGCTKQAQINELFQRAGEQLGGEKPGLDVHALVLGCMGVGDRQPSTLVVAALKALIHAGVTTTAERKLLSPACDHLHVDEQSGSRLLAGGALQHALLCSEGSRLV